MPKNNVISLDLDIGLKLDKAYEDIEKFRKEISESTIEVHFEKGNNSIQKIEEKINKLKDLYDKDGIIKITSKEQHNAVAKDIDFIEKEFKKLEKAYEDIGQLGNKLNKKQKLELLPEKEIDKINKLNKALDEYVNKVMIEIKEETIARKNQIKHRKYMINYQKNMKEKLEQTKSLQLN